MTVGRTATLRLTAAQLVVMLRALQERVVNADEEEREVLRPLAMVVQGSILTLARLPEPPPEPPSAPGAPQKPPPPAFSLAAIRLWARANGVPVSERGPVSAKVTRLYTEARRRNGVQ